MYITERICATKLFTSSEIRVIWNLARKSINYMKLQKKASEAPVPGLSF